MAQKHNTWGDKEISEFIISSIMGCAGTKQRRECVLPFHVAANTLFTVKEVEALHELFRKLSSSIVDDGFISKEELQLGLFGNSKKRSLFTDRMFNLFDSNKDGVLDFGEFVRSLNIFHPDTPQSEKAELPAVAFQLYDIWQTGFIERGEVMEMILALLYESDLILSDDLVKAIIDKTFQEADLNSDGKIDMEEWKDFVARNPSVLRNMTIPYLKDIRTTFPSFVQNYETDDEMNKFLQGGRIPP